MNSLGYNSRAIPHAVAGSFPPTGAGLMELTMLRHGSRSRIGRQFVSYPFHLTRPFELDAAIPELLTIYQQSCSGGVYRGERLTNRFTLGGDTAAHITTQGATVVHDCHGQLAHHVTEATLEKGAFLALMPDPLVLFPGANCKLSVEARLSPGAVFIVADSFARHDPFKGKHPECVERVFEAYESEIVIRDASGRLLVRDCSAITGSAISGRYSPAGNWTVVSSFVLAGERERLPAFDALSGIAAGRPCVAGVSELPNAAGWGVRCLANDAITARSFAEDLFSLGVRAALGKLPRPRRK